MNTQQVWLPPQSLIKMQPVNILVGNGKKLMSSHPQLRSYGPPVFSNSGGQGVSHPAADGQQACREHTIRGFRSPSVACM